MYPDRWFRVGASFIFNPHRMILQTPTGNKECRASGRYVEMKVYGRWIDLSATAAADVREVLRREKIRTRAESQALIAQNRLRSKFIKSEDLRLHHRGGFSILYLSDSLWDNITPDNAQQAEDIIAKFVNDMKGLLDGKRD